MIKFMNIKLQRNKFYQAKFRVLLQRKTPHKMRRLKKFILKNNYCCVVPAAVSLSRLKIILKRKVFDKGFRFIPLPEGTR